MEVRVSHLDGVRFAIHARQHELICDQPQENGGQDSGMTPPEFLLGALGSCAAFYATQYLKTRNLALDGVAVTVTAEKLRQPTRLGNFRVRVSCDARLDETQTEGLRRAVHHCLVHNTLITPADIEISLATGDRGRVLAIAG